jgi:hypothetical protein
LLELNGEPIRYGEEKYYITMMGIPTADGPWGLATGWSPSRD